MGELFLLLWLKSNLKEKGLVWAYNSRRYSPPRCGRAQPQEFNEAGHIQMQPGISQPTRPGILFKTSSPTPKNSFPPARPHILTSPNSTNS